MRPRTLSAARTIWSSAAPTPGNPSGSAPVAACTTPSASSPPRGGSPSRSAGQPCGGPRRLRAGCGGHDPKRFFASEWRIYELKSEKVLGRTPAGPDGIALIEIPKDRWFIVEGELTCAASAGEVALSYRFLFERTGKNGFVQRAYTPESLVAPGNWNADKQLNYGEFRSRSLNGSSGVSQAVPAAPER